MASKLALPKSLKGLTELPPGIELHGKCIRIVFRYKNKRCREPLKGLAITPANIKYADRKRQFILHEIETNNFDYKNTFPDSPRAKKFPSNAPLTIEEALNRWLEIKKEDCAFSTMRGYIKDVNNYLIPRWGGYLFSELKKTELEYWLVKELRTLAPKTINNLSYPLRTVIKDAFLDGIIDRDPFAQIAYVEKELASDADPFSNKELKKLLETPTHRVNEINLIEFSCFSGLSISEAIGLAWEDVDWINGTITVKRVAVLGNYKQPKTYKRRRTLKLFDQAFDALKRQKALTFLSPTTKINVRHRRKLVQEELHFIFPSSFTNKPFTDSKNLHRPWRTILRKAGIRHRGINQCRHTFASRLLTLGKYPEKWIADYLGHTTTTMLHKHYGKFIKEDRPDIESSASKDIRIELARVS